MFFCRVWSSQKRFNKIVLTYVTPMFLKEDDTLFDWKDKIGTSKNNETLDVSVPNFGSPVLKGYAMYAFISNNGKLTKLENHHKWIHDKMEHHSTLST